jgi:hypothetical protein
MEGQNAKRMAAAPKKGETKNEAHGPAVWPRSKQVAAGLLILAAAIIVAWAVQRLVAPPGLTVSCEIAPEYEEQMAEGLPTGQFYVRDQIIVSGPSGPLDEVIAAARGEGLDLGLVRSCQISYRPARAKDVEDAPFSHSELRDLSTRLYVVSGGSSTDEALRLISELAQDSNVTADPNYLLGLAGQSPCSNPTDPSLDPYTWGLSPYTWGLSPYTWGLSPYTWGLSPTGAASASPETAFWSQWPLVHIGLDASPQGGLQPLPNGACGESVRVAVLDAAPFEALEAGGPDRTEVINWISPELRLHVSQPELLPLVPSDPQPAEDVGDHGLFVAGLVHAVAPESEIHLIRVVNNYGCGDLFTLNEAILNFVAGVEKDRRALDGAVINLSLGVVKPSEAEVSEARKMLDDMVSERAIEDTRAREIVDLLEQIENDPVESLQAAMLIARSQGIVVVAASGNDSYASASPLPPQIPASSPYVIGVSGTNATRQRSCFSNWGDVAAPAGEGVYSEKAGIGCASSLEHCSGPCDDAVISLALSSPTGYGYWMGTSFSAPLVSGLAALLMDQGAGCCGWADPDEVFNAIRCGAPTPDGVINVPAALSGCMP